MARKHVRRLACARVHATLSRLRLNICAAAWAQFLMQHENGIDVRRAAGDGEKEEAGTGKDSEELESPAPWS